MDDNRPIASDEPTADPRGLTRRWVAAALATRFDALPDDVRRVARDCLVDWLACTFAALDEPVSRIVAEAARDEGGHPQATLLGRPWRGSMAQAALVNGATSHALDYDDVNLNVPGHMTAAIVPALLALAEERDACAADFIAALVAGHEFACRVGRLVEPAHYANGFHATATIGALGAATACARLLGLDAEIACHAVGLAATQAAGLKAMFGSMAKPLHAGLASQAGLRAVLLAAKGLASRVDAIECAQGFVRVHGNDFDLAAADAVPPGGFRILDVLFKFHAACYSTHSTIEAVAALRRSHALDVASVVRIDVVAGEGCSICNIQRPVTGLEAKFSLRACAAFALLGIDTADLASWERVVDADVTPVLERVSVALVPGGTLGDSTVSLTLVDGTTLTQAYDAGRPLDDKSAQSDKVFAKFAALVTPVLGAKRTASILAATRDFDRDAARDIRSLTRLCGARPTVVADRRRSA